ncbi:adenosine receptor A2b-like [Antedon mediterranea]|uniref:adenosine receptor A2b-like n=1 Tax=Antedon mediterranea TaxID=105859 RepID=UPI003AF6C0CA
MDLCINGSMENSTSHQSWMCHVTIRVVQGLLGSFAFIGNIFTLIVAMFTKEIRRKQSNYLILNLAMTDAAIGAVCAILGIYGIKKSVGLNFIIESVLVCSSSIVIILIASERCFAIILPFKHRRYVTKKALVTVICLDWCVILSIILTVYLQTDLGDAYIILNLVSVSILLCVSLLNALIYLAIILAVRQNAIRIRNTGNVFQRSERKRNIKMIITFTLIAGILIACCIPYAVSFIIFYCLDYKKKTFSQSELIEVIFIIKLLTPLNSGINTFVYWWRITEFRTAYIRAIRGIFCCAKMTRVTTFNRVLTIRSILQLDHAGLQ